MLFSAHLFLPSVTVTSAIFAKDLSLLQPGNLLLFLCFVFFLISTQSFASFLKNSLLLWLCNPGPSLYLHLMSSAFFLAFCSRYFYILMLTFQKRLLIFLLPFCLEHFRDSDARHSIFGICCMEYLWYGKKKEENPYNQESFYSAKKET